MPTLPVLGLSEPLERKNRALRKLTPLNRTNKTHAIEACKLTWRAAKQSIGDEN